MRGENLYLLTNFLNDFFNIKAAIIALITVGLITVMTAMTYYLERRALKRSRHFGTLVHLLEAVAVVGSVILLRQTFWVLNSGDIVSWGYAIAQLTVLLFSLYLMRNLAVEVVNVIMPIAFYAQGMYMGHGGQYVAVFISMTLLLTGAIIYISRHRTDVMDTEWKYLLLQLVYGGTWSFIIWSVHPFNLIYTINVLVVFVFYMWIIRFFVKRLTNLIDHLDSLDQAINYDELTGVRNRANFDSTTVGVFGVYQKHPSIPITMVMFDIDHFKTFNDQYGHLTGDAVLKHVAQHFKQELFKQTARGQLFRYGGEEFVIIFRGVSATDAQRIVTGIRDTLQQNPVEANGQALAVNVSFGISELRLADDDFDAWFKRVDHYLYQSKKAGRNRCTVEGVTVALS